ncbi:uracil-xanthine permease family protein [Zhihengliuella flava]|uniref:Uracil-xanthine permease n=1 Tax=Zhihengliuella flava TaxID=1285193 RepID=A0A931GEU8_9MICC|nr:solute carrier family 23 protein [Zhihengliuella flava]MBG6084753.1 uracil-xanthine permease [Zhihengliuella flava]
MSNRFGFGWRLHGDGKTIRPGTVVAPDERLSWAHTAGIGVQHVMAMFGATVLVPAITGFPATTTLLFSGLGTLLFLIITAGRVPSYLGSSFAFLAPVGAATSQHGMAGALGGILITGVALFVVGVIVQRAGTEWIHRLMPPAVMGTIVALIGLNLAGTTLTPMQEVPVTTFATVGAIVVSAVLFKGLLGRLSILVGIVVGYVVALVQGEVDYSPVGEASWVGAPTFTAPAFHLDVMLVFLPVVFVLIAENIGHVKTVGLMTRRDLDGVYGRALMADGAATVLAGAGGGSGTTTYAENIGVMASSRVYSTAAYWVAGAVAILLAFSPKVGAVINTIPAGVTGGAGIILYGMIGMIGARLWVQNRVDFSNPINLMTAGAGLIIAIAMGSSALMIGDVQLGGIAVGTIATLVIFHAMTLIARARGTEPVTSEDTEAAETSKLG